MFEPSFSDQKEAEKIIAEINTPAVTSEPKPARRVVRRNGKPVQAASPNPGETQYYMLNQSDGTFTPVTETEVCRVAAAIYGDDSKVIVSAKVLKITVAVLE